MPPASTCFSTPSRTSWLVVSGWLVVGGWWLGRSQLRLRAIEPDLGEPGAIGRQRYRSLWHLRRAQQERQHVEPFGGCHRLVAGRHRHHAIEHSAQIPAVPSVEKLRACERGRLLAAAEIVAVTARAAGEIDLLSRVGLCRRVDARPDREGLGEQQRNHQMKHAALY